MSRQQHGQFVDQPQTQPPGWTAEALFDRVRQLGLAADAAVASMRKNVASGRFPLRHYVSMWDAKIRAFERDVPAGSPPRGKGARVPAGSGGDASGAQQVLRGAAWTGSGQLGRAARTGALSRRTESHREATASVESTREVRLWLFRALTPVLIWCVA
jgi:hypothetical protein